MAIAFKDEPYLQLEPAPTVCPLCLCFCETSADDLSSDMSLQGIAVQCLHGDREQSSREEALQDFKDSMSEKRHLLIFNT